METLWRGRRFHSKVETCSGLERAEERIEELCKQGWEPYAVVPLKNTVEVFLKHYCTRPEKACILCSQDKT